MCISTASIHLWRNKTAKGSDHETSKRDWIEQIYSTMLISIVKISESFFGRKTSIYAYKGLASQLVAISVRKQILLPMSC